MSKSRGVYRRRDRSTSSESSSSRQGRDRLRSKSRSRSRTRSSVRSSERDKKTFGNITNSKDPKDIDSRVFIGNLGTEEISRHELDDLFSLCGKVAGVSVHRGFAFVQYFNKEDAERGVEKYNNTYIKSRRVDCNLAGERQKNQEARTVMDRDRDRDRGSREGSRILFDPYDRPYDRQRSRERSPLRDPYADRYRGRDSELDRRRLLDERDRDPYDRHDPFPPRERDRVDDYYRGRRDVRDIRDERDDPYARDPRRDEIRERDHYERPSARDRLPRAYADFKEPAPQPTPDPIQRPVDCEVIVVNRQQRDYAETVERRLKQIGLIVDIIFLTSDVSLGQALDDVSRRGVLYATMITSQHELHRSVTLNILHGTPQEHRNMPLDDAMTFIARNFERYMQNLREKSLAANLSLATGVELTVPQLLCLLADGKQLTVGELGKVIDYLQDRKNKLLEGEVGNAQLMDVRMTTADDKASTQKLLELQQQQQQQQQLLQQRQQQEEQQQQQADLQAKILKIFNPSGTAASSAPTPTTADNSTANRQNINPFGIASVAASQQPQAKAQPVQPATRPQTSIPSLMDQPVPPPTNVLSKIGKAAESRPQSSAPPVSSTGNAGPGSEPGLSQQNGQASAPGVGINFDNPSVQKALDNLIQSGPNLLKNLGQVSQIVKGATGGQSQAKASLTGPQSASESGYGQAGGLGNSGRGPNVEGRNEGPGGYGGRGEGPGAFGSRGEAPGGSRGGPAGYGGPGRLENYGQNEGGGFGRRVGEDGGFGGGMDGYGGGGFNAPGRGGMDRGFGMGGDPGFGGGGGRGRPGMGPGPGGMGPGPGGMGQGPRAGMGPGAGIGPGMGPGMGMGMGRGRRY
uniref:Nuclear receptor coactivator 5-like isoform X3 n=1 Tax=Saccoglossus kowalevskii TaxID=10224 RepID=A0ABM0M2B8_SACKO|nr:PREDICTED: nuclear receptor coactivator 5-like isoform X3 [Saccoglossus kowalevskii]